MITIDAGLGGYSIIQNVNQGHEQMMSYIITTPNKKVIVIDGGRENDVEYLREKLMALGGVVDMWHITHAHRDHMDAFTHIMNEPNGIEVKSVYWDFPPEDWIREIYPGGIESLALFYYTIGANKDISTEVKKGMSFLLDGLKLEVLFDSRHYLETNNLNDTSLVYRVVFPNKVVALFLGDLAGIGGEHLADEYGDKLKSDIVQMAHHGQKGVSRRVYELIRPKVCLWPTPKWLWENDSGEGYNSGSWLTLETRSWMDELGAQIHGVMKDGEIVVI